MLPGSRSLRGVHPSSHGRFSVRLVDRPTETKAHMNAGEVKAVPGTRAPEPCRPQTEARSTIRLGRART